MTSLPFPPRSARPLAIALVSGLLFALGLGVAGMTSPAKVLAFLDVTGDWDPSLAFVMVGAVGVHAAAARWAMHAIAAGRPPLAAPRFVMPEERRVDRPLLAGAALFGVGWGLAGYCPGPGIVAFVSAPTAIVFVGAMLAGMWGTRVVQERMRAPGTDPGAT